MNFGLRSRVARGVLPAPAAAVVPPGATVEPGKDSTDVDGNKAANITDPKDDASEEELDEHGNPKKEEPAAAAPPPVAGLTGNARVKAILGHPSATAQRPLAEYLALDTEIDAVACSEILGKVTAVATPAPKAAGDPPFLAAMKNTANPKVPAASTAAAVEPGTDADAIATMKATLTKMGLAK